MRLGKITENALKRSVLKQLRTEFKKETSAAVGTDCAFSTKGEGVFSTIVPVTANTDNAGYYGVVKAVNGLVSQGITPDHVEVSVLLPAEADNRRNGSRCGQVRDELNKNRYRIDSI